MKYLLMIHVDPAQMETLSEEDREKVFGGHEGFMAMLRQTGEFVGTDALADPTNSRTVRVRAGVRTVTDGPYVETKEFFAGYYVVDCESVERAIDLAALVPDAAFTGIEVRPVMFSAGQEM